MRVADNAVTLQRDYYPKQLDVVLRLLVTEGRPDAASAELERIAFDATKWISGQR